MKYVVIIGDGMADFPIQELGGKTPLMVAEKPYMDMMAMEGFCGRVLTIPDGLPSGSDVACLSIFGYNPAKAYTGRAPIEAAGMGIPMTETDVAFRCNLVYIEDQPDGPIMVDYSGGHITTLEAKAIIEEINGLFGNNRFSFFTGVGYRHIMIWRDGEDKMTTTPPHDIIGKEIAPYMPAGKGADEIKALMAEVAEFLKGHRVNIEREKMGMSPANGIWLWGQGKRLSLPLFLDRYGLKGATVAAVDLIKGISRLIGFDAPHVEGATGYLDTDYKAKAEKAIELLNDHDIVYIHIEAPDEASHNANLKEKIKAIESIDKEIVRRLYEATPEDSRFLVVTDHATPIIMKTHYACPVPFVIFDKKRRGKGPAIRYDEQAGVEVFDGEEMVSAFLKGERP